MKKRTYLPPEIELIRLDAEISLALQSDLPPEGPDEFVLNSTNDNLYQPDLLINS